MIKVIITPARFALAANVMEYLAVSRGSKDVAIRLVPRFIMNGDNDYLVKVKLDEDGDIEGYENMDAAFDKLSKMNPARVDKLAGELVEAAKAIVNPPSEGGSNKPTSTDTAKPPSGS